MNNKTLHRATLSRRALMKGGLAGLGLAGIGMLPASLARAAQNVAAQAAANGKILVVLELSGGNDGLNTVVPYADDAYYRARPGIGLPKDRLRLLDDHFGLNPGMALIWSCVRMPGASGKTQTMCLTSSLAFGYSMVVTP